MSVPILTTTSVVLCPHGGTARLLTSNLDLRIENALALLVTDQHPVVGCPFMVGPKHQPCVVVRWFVGATLTKVRGIPVLLRTSVGVCFSVEQIPQGPPVVVHVQQRGRGI